MSISQPSGIGASALPRAMPDVTKQNTLPVDPFGVAARSIMQPLEFRDELELVLYQSGRVGLAAAGERAAAHDLFDAHLPLLRYEQQPGVGLAVRKYVMKRRGLLGSEVQRKPASPLSPAARAEVDFLLERLARHDPRARV